MASPVFLASLVTIVPAMGALWWFLKRYEGYFEDARVFFALVFGFFAGLAAVTFELFTGFGEADFIAAAGAGTAFTFFVIGYSFFEAMIKTMVVGLGRFRGRRDTPYYGAAFGLGFGAMAALMVVANALRRAEGQGTDYSTAGFVLMALLPMGSIFAHGATGALAGKASADNQLWKAAGWATLLQMPVWGAYWLYWPNLGRGDLPLTASLFPVVFTVAYGMALLWITQKRVLDLVVPKEIQDKLRRERRREARGLAPLAALDSEE